MSQQDLLVTPCIFKNRLQLRACIPIEAGEEICNQYVLPLSHTLARRNHLKTKWHFDCECQRCSDPYELGSNLSTLLCPRYLLRRNSACPQFSPYWGISGNFDFFSSPFLEEILISIGEKWGILQTRKSWFSELFTYYSCSFALKNH